MEQKLMLLVYYKGVAPMQQEIPAMYNRRKFSHSFNQQRFHERSFITVRENCENTTRLKCGK
jgi:hypothetical protein